MDLAALGITKLQVFVLVLTRTAGIFTLNPTFGSNHIPMQARMAVAIGLALVFLPMVSPAAHMPGDVPGMVLMIAREALVGLVIGFVCTLVFVAVETAGHIIDAQSGFSFAAIVDPATGVNSAVASRFYSLLTILLFFATNAHHVVIKGLADSFLIAPIGQVGMNTAVVGGALELFSALFLVAIRIAAPVIAALFLADVALAIISRIIPQMNVFIVGLPLKLGIALVGILIMIPYVGGVTHDIFGDMYRQTLTLVGLMAH